jgi:hypothetical protein
MDLGIKSEDGEDSDVILRGPYRFEIDHSKNKVKVIHSWPLDDSDGFGVVVVWSNENY